MAGGVGRLRPSSWSLSSILLMGIFLSKKKYIAFLFIEYSMFWRNLVGRFWRKETTIKKPGYYPGGRRSRVLLVYCHALCASVREGRASPYALRAVRAMALVFFSAAPGVRVWGAACANYLSARGPLTGYRLRSRLPTRSALNAPHWGAAPRAPVRWFSFRLRRF